MCFIIVRSNQGNLNFIGSNIKKVKPSVGNLGYTCFVRNVVSPKRHQSESEKHVVSPNKKEHVVSPNLKYT